METSIANVKPCDNFVSNCIFCRRNVNTLLPHLVDNALDDSSSLVSGHGRRLNHYACGAIELTRKVGTVSEVCALASGIIRKVTPCLYSLGI
jgi:hypothetical protein